MSQYKPDGVNYPVVTVVNGSNAVIIQGFNATAEIGVGDYFFVQGDNGRYEVNAAAIVYSGGNTTLHLTTNYAGASSTTAIGVFHRDFTVNLNLPLIQVNDLQAAELMARALNLIDAASMTSPSQPTAMIWNSSTVLTAGNPSWIFQGGSNTERLQIRSAVTTGGQPALQLLGSRGTIASPAVLQANDPAGYLAFGGYDSTGWNRAAWLQGYAGENYDATHRGTGMIFSVTPLASTTITEAMRITPAGSVGVGTTTPNYTGFNSALTIQNTVAAGFELASTRADGDQQFIGAIAGQYRTNSAGHQLTNYIGFVSDGTTVNQRGGATVFYTKADGTTSFTEKMRLTSAGNLNFGGTGQRITGDFSHGTHANRLMFQNSISNSNTIVGFLPSGSATVGQLNLYNSSDTVNCCMGQFQVTSGAVNIISIALGTGVLLPIAFNIAGSERARIDTSGNFLVGQTAIPNYASTTNTGFFAASTGVVGASAAGRPLVLQRTGSDGAIVDFSRQNTIVGSISVTASATAYNTSSDYRLKDNQKPLLGSGKFIDALKPKTWQWACDGSQGVGFIAHEVQEVSPSSVTGEKDAEDEDGKPIMQAVAYGSSEIIANLVAELQSLRKRIAKLENNDD